MITVVRKRETSTHVRLSVLEQGIRIEWGYIKCLTSTHVRLSVLEQGIRIEWGYIKCLTFRPVTMEMMLYSEYPELLAIWDGQAWNLDDLNALLTDADGAALAEAGLLLLTQKDINLLSSVGLALG